MATAETDKAGTARKKAVIGRPKQENPWRERSCDMRLRLEKTDAERVDQIAKANGLSRQKFLERCITEMLVHNGLAPLSKGA